MQGRRACVRRAWVSRARHAERRQKGRPEGSRPVHWSVHMDGRPWKSAQRKNDGLDTPCWKTRRRHRAEWPTGLLSLSPWSWFSGCRKRALKDWGRGRGKDWKRDLTCVHWSCSRGPGVIKTWHRSNFSPGVWSECPRLAHDVPPGGRERCQRVTVNPGKSLNLHCLGV